MEVEEKEVEEKEVEEKEPIIVGRRGATMSGLKGSRGRKGGLARNSCLSLASFTWLLLPPAPGSFPCPLLLSFLLLLPVFW